MKRVKPKKVTRKISRKDMDVRNYEDYLMLNRYPIRDTQNVVTAPFIQFDVQDDPQSAHGTGKSGALSSGHVLPHWEVPLSLDESAARRMDKGHENDKYPIHNWRSGLGDVAFLRDRAGHAKVHLVRFLNGDNTVDDAQGNVDALTWFCAMINEALRLHPDTVAKAFYAEPRGENGSDSRGGK